MNEKNWLNRGKKIEIEKDYLFDNRFLVWLKSDKEPNISRVAAVIQPPIKGSGYDMRIYISDNFKTEVVFPKFEKQVLAFFHKLLKKFRKEKS